MSKIFTTNSHPDIRGQVLWLRQVNNTLKWLKDHRLTSISGNRTDKTYPPETNIIDLKLIYLSF